MDLCETRIEKKKQIDRMGAKRPCRAPKRWQVKHMLRFMLPPAEEFHVAFAAALLVGQGTITQRLAAQRRGLSHADGNRQAVQPAAYQTLILPCTRRRATTGRNQRSGTLQLLSTGWCCSPFPLKLQKLTSNGRLPCMSYGRAHNTIMMLFMEAWSYGSALFLQIAGFD
jgi:hypothetical protein